MTTARLTPWLIAAAVAVLLAASLGYLIGTGSAKDGGDAAAAREQGYETTYQPTLDRIETIARKRGLKAGRARGAKAGEKVGIREGADLGGGYASVQLGQAEADAAAAAQAAAQGELADRRANCGILVRAPDSCPTSAEVAAYRAAIAAAREARQQEQQQQQMGEQPDDGR
jgi:hypothetical protein